MRQKVKGQMSIIGKIVFILFALGMMLWIVYKWSSGSSDTVDNIQNCNGGTYKTLLGAKQGVCSPSKDCTDPKLPKISNSYWFSVGTGCPNNQFCCLQVPSNGDGTDAHTGCTARDNANGIWTGLCAQSTCATDMDSKGQGDCSSGEVCCVPKTTKVVRTLEACYAGVSKDSSKTPTPLAPIDSSKSDSKLKVSGYCDQKGCNDDSFDKNKIYLSFNGGVKETGNTPCSSSCCAEWKCYGYKTGQVNGEWRLLSPITIDSNINGYCSNSYTQTQCNNPTPPGKVWVPYGEGTCDAGYRCCVLSDNAPAK